MSHENPPLKIDVSLAADLKALRAMRDDLRSSPKRDRLRARCLEAFEARVLLPNANTETTRAITATCDPVLIDRLRPSQIDLDLEDLQNLSNSQFQDLVALGLRLRLGGPLPTRNMIDHMLERYASSPSPELRAGIETWTRGGGLLGISWWLITFTGIENALQRDLAHALVHNAIQCSNSMDNELQCEMMRKQALIHAGRVSAAPVAILLLAGLKVSENLEAAIFATMDMLSGVKRMLASNHLRLALTPDAGRLAYALSPAGFRTLQSMTSS